MKATLQNVLIGAVVLAVLVYFLYPTAFVREGFETDAGQIGGYIMLAIFLFIVIGGLIASFNAPGSK